VGEVIAPLKEKKGAISCRRAKKKKKKKKKGDIFSKKKKNLGERNERVDPLIFETKGKHLPLPKFRRKLQKKKEGGEMIESGIPVGGEKKGKGLPISRGITIMIGFNRKGRKGGRKTKNS